MMEPRLTLQIEKWKNWNLKINSFSVYLLLKVYRDILRGDILLSNVITTITIYLWRFIIVTIK